MPPEVIVAHAVQMNILSCMKLLIHQEVAAQYSEERLVLMNHFVKYCERALELHDGCMLYVVEDRKKYGIDTTGEFENDGKTIYVYAKGRAFVDVLRSISHELVHVRQHQDGYDRHHDLLHFDSDLEDEANRYGMAILNAYSEVMGHDIIYQN